jgi:hypothetical protein
MAQKKETNKKDVKVQDLAPKKDAKGGGRFDQNAANLSGANVSGSNLNGNRSQNASSSNTSRSAE